MIALYIILGIIAFFCLLLSIKVRVEAEYYDSFKVRLKWLFLHFDVYPMAKKEKKPKKEEPKKEEPPKEEPPEEKPKKPNMFKTFYENQGVPGVVQLIKDSADALGSLMKSIKNHLIIERLYLWIVVSSNADAASTAIEYGEMCQNVFPALGFICSNLKVKHYDANIEPDFIGTFPSAQFETEIAIRPIFIINAAIVMAVRLLFKVILKLLRQKPKEPAEEDSNKNKDSQNIQGGALQ